MKTISRKLAFYLFNNFIGNFLGFIIGIASTRLVSEFFATRSIKNLWGLTSRKTIVDKQTFSIMEMTVSIIVGFIVFEIISKTVKRKIDEMMPQLKSAVKKWFIHAEVTEALPAKRAVAGPQGPKRIYRDVQ